MDHDDCDGGHGIFEIALGIVLGALILEGLPFLLIGAVVVVVGGIALVLIGVLAWWMYTSPGEFTVVVGLLAALVTAVCGWDWAQPRAERWLAQRTRVRLGELAGFVAAPFFFFGSLGLAVAEAFASRPDWGKISASLLVAFAIGIAVRRTWLLIQVRPKPPGPVEARPGSVPGR